MDVVIGTHRLLSKDVKFPDLGLLVVDEEQRFGVAHKERLKEMRKNVDALSLSATPIPRTLHMSLVGLRDMSIIETPPRDRLAIQTVVASFQEELVRKRDRNGTRTRRPGLFHSQPRGVDLFAGNPGQKLVPKARVVVAHGQMGEKELEKVMLKFIRDEADVLVATTIVENGLDIPQSQYDSHQSRGPAGTFRASINCAGGWAVRISAPMPICWCRRRPCCRKLRANACPQ